MASGSGFRRQSSFGGGGVEIEDGLNTTKIVNIKANLKPVASKIFENTNKGRSHVGHFRI